jgi:glycine hydroxymethyltransferase
VSNDADLAERLDAIAYPGLTANFDVAKAAALAMTLLDWKVHGRAYAAAMVATAGRLANELASHGLPVFTTSNGSTTSHQLAIHAQRWGGGQAASKRLRRANILACGIGLPTDPVEPLGAGDVAGLRLGVPEIVRLGMGPDDMPALARLVHAALDGNEAPDILVMKTKAFRRQFETMRFVR